MFDLLKKIMKESDEASLEKEKKDVEVGVAYSNFKSIENSVEAANADYNKPEYNPQTRREFYDDGYAHKAAIDRAFESGEIVRDPYTGAELVKSQKEAKLRFGEDWQAHAAEADHKDPLNKVYERNKDNAFITAEDIKEVGNRDSNFQVISRKVNQFSKEMGKGGSTQREWANDKDRMEGLESNIESGESINTVKSKIRNRGRAAEQKTDGLLDKRSWENAIQTGHEAGMRGAQDAGITSATLASIDELVMVLKGDKSASDALGDIAKISGESAVKSYVKTGGMTLATHKMRYSTNEFIRSLAKNNVPAQILSGVQIAGTAITKWMSGEISTQECFLQVGQNGLNYATMPFWGTVGQGLIPIPVVGGAIGMWFGSMITSSFMGSYFTDLKRREYEHLQRQKRIREYDAITAKYNGYREEFENFIADYLQDCKSTFDEAISSMQTAFANGDAEGFVRDLNKITEKVNGKRNFESFDEFKSSLGSDKEFVL